MYTKEHFKEEAVSRPPDIHYSKAQLKEMELLETKHPFAVEQVVITNFAEVTGHECKQTLEKANQRQFTVAKAWSRGHLHLVKFVGVLGTFEACFFKKAEQKKLGTF